MRCQQELNAVQDDYKWDTVVVQGGDALAAVRDDEEGEKKRGGDGSEDSLQGQTRGARPFKMGNCQSSPTLLPNSARRLPRSSNFQLRPNSTAWPPRHAIASMIAYTLRLVLQYTLRVLCACLCQCRRTTAI